MIKYAEVTELNDDQISLIEGKGWCIFTECVESHTYWRKGLAWANRIGYLVFEKSIEAEEISSYDELNKIAEYDDDFNAHVREILKPIADIVYVFLVKDPKYYKPEPVCTNKGLEYAKKLAKSRFSYKTEYYPEENYDKMRKIIKNHNQKVERETRAAIKLLKDNGFNVLSKDFAARKTY